MPIWLINIPALYGSTDQQQYNQEQKWRQKHQYERQANNSKNSRYDQGKSCNHSSQPGTKEEKEGITSYHSTNVSKETFLNNIHQTVESLSHLSYPTVKPHNNIPQTNYYQNISSYYKPVNEESKISQALNGHEVHSDCYVNMDGRQEIHVY
ncbi:unnamed protein product [Heterobilharzia americana]|nr:unnamed protein product [Heterobilharzia americana]